MVAPAAPAAVSALTPDSSTATVAAWAVAHGLRASVVGRWVWVPFHQLHVKGFELESLMVKASGWKPSKRRQSWYHDCGVAATGKRVTGQLSRYHRVIGAPDYVGKRGPWAWFSKGRSTSGGRELDDAATAQVAP